MSTGLSLALRPYQREAMQAIAHSRARRQIVALPTGTGKTVIFAHLIAAFVRAGRRAIVLVHRDELVAQTLDKLETIAPGLDVGVVKAERDEHTASVVVASVQTVSRPRRLDRLARDFALAIVDEAHHATAPTWSAVLGHLGCWSEGGPLVVGFTATPERADGTSLGAVFADVVYRRDMLSMIEAGYLCDLRGVQVRLAVELGAVQRRGGDFVEADLACALERAQAPEHLVQAYRMYATGRKALAFLPSVALSGRTAALFCEAGLPAALLSATTPLDERRHILAQFKEGSIQIVSNCGVLTEGFDEPSVSCILLGRPTQSRPLYKQMVGRAARKHPGKADALIIDCVGATTRHDLVTLESLFDLPPGGLQDTTVTESVAGQRLEKAAAEQARAGAIVGREVDLLRRRPLHWTQRQGLWALSVPGGALLLKPDGDGYIALRSERGRVVEQLSTPLPLHYAQGTAEDYAREHRLEALAAPGAPWRGRRPTEKQVAEARRLGQTVTEDMTSGEVSDLITAAQAQRALRGSRR